MTGAALVTGNTVVIKPSSDTPTIAAKLVEILLEAGFPSRSLALVTGQYDRVLTFSVGAVTFASPPLTVDELLSKADRVMYEVKAGGKNRSAHKLIGQPLPAL